MRVAVIGSGVIGLSSAIRLREAGCMVSVFSKGDLAATVSARAGAVFSGFDIADLTQIEESFRTFVALTKDEPAGGVRMARASTYDETPGGDIPRWTEVAGGARKLGPLGPYAGGFEVVTPHIDMTRYLPWLAASAARRGVELQQRHIRDLGEPAAEGFDAVVNCAGLGARELAADPAVRPMRGQAIHVPNDLGLNDSIAAHESDGSVTYVYPHPGHVVLGGTYEPDVWDETTDARALDAILMRCRVLLKLLGNPRWEEIGRRRLCELAGLRPARILAGTTEAIRLEAEHRPDGRLLIHNYGHGRCGVTMSWGCAAEVVRLLRKNAHG